MYGTHTVRFNPTVCIHISGLRVLVILKRETWCTLQQNYVVLAIYVRTYKQADIESIIRLGRLARSARPICYKITTLHHTLILIGFADVRQPPFRVVSIPREDVMTQPFFIVWCSTGASLSRLLLAASSPSIKNPKSLGKGL